MDLGPPRNRRKLECIEEEVTLCEGGDMLQEDLKIRPAIPVHVAVDFNAALDLLIAQLTSL